jgi:hypothetical protein
MWGYWCRVGHRATKNTLEFLGWNRPARIAFRVVAPLITIFLGTYLVGVESAVSRGEWLILGAVVSAGAFLIVLMGYLVGTPHRLDRELATQRDNARDQLLRWTETEDTGRLFEELWRKGNALRNGAERGIIWKIDIKHWFEEVDREAHRLPPNEAFMLVSHSQPPDMLMSSQTFLDALNARLGKLRLVVDRLLTPPNRGRGTAG